MDNVEEMARNSLAPLGKLWDNLDKAQANKHPEEFTLETAKTLTEKAITLIGQTICATTFTRRKTILNALNFGEDSKSLAITKALTEEENSDDDGLLFGPTFYDSVRISAKQQITR